MAELEREEEETLCQMVILLIDWCIYNAINPQSLLISRIRERNEIKREREEEEEEEGIEQGAVNLTQGEWHTATFLWITRIGERERERVGDGWLAVEWRDRGLGSGVEREVLSPIYHRWCFWFSNFILLLIILLCNIYDMARLLGKKIMTWTHFGYLLDT